jgi:hypothetical protein
MHPRSEAHPAVRFCPYCGQPLGSFATDRQKLFEDNARREDTRKRMGVGLERIGGEVGVRLLDKSVATTRGTDRERSRRRPAQPRRPVRRASESAVL